MVLLHHAERRQRLGDRRIHHHGPGGHRENEPAIVRTEKIGARVLSDCRTSCCSLAASAVSAGTQIEQPTVLEVVDYSR